MPGGRAIPGAGAQGSRAFRLPFAGGRARGSSASDSRLATNVTSSEFWTVLSNFQELSGNSRVLHSQRGEPDSFFVISLFLFGIALFCPSLQWQVPPERTAIVVAVPMGCMLVPDPSRWAGRIARGAAVAVAHRLCRAEAGLEGVGWAMCACACVRACVWVYSMSALVCACGSLTIGVWSCAHVARPVVL